MPSKTTTNIFASISIRFSIYKKNKANDSCKTKRLYGSYESLEGGQTTDGKIWSEYKISPFKVLIQEFTIFWK